MGVVVNVQDAVGGHHMNEFNPLTPKFSVCSQVTEDDIKRAAASGYTVLINNRPDGEEDGQLSHTDAQRAAESAGMTYVYLPFKGPAGPDIVEKTQDILRNHNGPILAHCRSGTRSTNVWAVAAVLENQITIDDAITAARAQGYDISHLPERLSSFA